MTLQHAATHCHTLQRTATHCNTLLTLFLSMNGKKSGKKKESKRRKGTIERETESLREIKRTKE